MLLSDHSQALNISQMDLPSVLTGGANPYSYNPYGSYGKNISFLDFVQEKIWNLKIK